MPQSANTPPPIPPADSQANRFIHCTRVYGASRKRWPLDEQAGYDLCAQTEWGQVALAAAEELDNWLDRQHSVEPDISASAAWIQNTLDAAYAARPSSPKPVQRPSRWGLNLAVTCGLVFCTAGGFATGFTGAVQAKATNPTNATALTDVDLWLVRWGAEIRQSQATAKRS
jgi:hypothetical protein